MTSGRRTALLLVPALALLADGSAVTMPAAPSGAAPGIKPMPDLDLEGPVDAYRAWVGAALPGLLGTCRALDAAVGRGDLNGARSDRPPAHLDYERLGAACNAFGDFDGEINGASSATGFFAIEYELRHGSPASELRPLTRGLVADVAALIHPGLPQRGHRPRRPAVAGARDPGEHPAVPAHRRRRPRRRHHPGHRLRQHPGHPGTADQPDLTDPPPVPQTSSPRSPPVLFEFKPTYWPPDRDRPGPRSAASPSPSANTSTAMWARPSNNSPTYRPCGPPALPPEAAVPGPADPYESASAAPWKIGPGCSSTNARRQRRSMPHQGTGPPLLSSAHVTKPVIVHPPHWVTTKDILANIERNTCDDAGRPHPKFAAWARVIRNSGVSCRSLMHPLDSPEVSGHTGLVARNAAAWTATQDLAEKAARQALDTAGLQPTDIDALVTSHTTSWAVPQLDVSLINRLGLRPDVRTIAMTSLACVGGTKALAKAADDVRSHPGSRVLVVVGEAISNIYHHSDQGIESQIYKALFGDSAGACIVSAERFEAGLAIQASRQYVLPNSAHNSYWGRLDTAGFHFDSTREAIKGPANVMPDLFDWLKVHDFVPPDWALIHAGGPAILAAVEKGLDLSPDQLAHSYASLDNVGNLGGVSVLDVLRRTHTTPPAPGTRGVALSFGPGFTYVSLIGTWTT